MGGEFDGLKIAQEHIAREARERTGKLDLAGLDLEEIPKEIAGLTHLRELDVGWREEEDGDVNFNRRLTSLAPLEGLVALQSLDCRFTQIADLAPLAGLVALQWLDCSSTQVADLAPLAGLVALQSLACSVTKVADLAPLEGLVALQSLRCSSTKVADLAPVVGLPALADVDANYCHLATLPRAWIESAPLATLCLYRTRDPDIPSGVLSAQYDENCLPALRAYFAESGPGDPRLQDVKLMVLGNGRVGKTQLCNRLLGRAYEAHSRSTHGVTVDRLSLPRGEGKQPIPLHIWDFGGQDIYHGTHALFLRDHAIFALVWARDFEAPSDDRGDERFGNRPLRYWADYVKHASGDGRAVIAVQTRCDSARDEAPLPIPEADLRETFDHFTRVEVSAFKPRGISAFREKLAEAAEYALEHEGAPKIPAAWARVKAALEAWLVQDGARPKAMRLHRTLTTEEFAALCREQGVKSEPKHLLQYLHRSGVVFYQPGLLQDRIVLDQAWALEAIYAVFDRDSGAWLRLQRQRGRFTPSDLAGAAWADRSASERALFLDMMSSCGVCFRLRTSPGDDEEEDVYIAPEALPERPRVAMEIESRWGQHEPDARVSYRHAFLHDGLMRAIIAEIGGLAGVHAIYWRDGLCFYDSDTRAHALIELRLDESWSGEIVAEAKGERAGDLLARACETIESAQQRLGLEGERVGEAPSMPRGPKDEAKLNPGRDPKAAPRFYVSYAWADDADPERDKEVDDLCEAATTKGQPIFRDKEQIKLGDRISEFMAALAKADRIFIVLSEKYFRSEACMTELVKSWLRCGGDEAEFRGRTRIFARKDAKFRKPEEQQAILDHWSAEADRRRAAAIGPRYTRVGNKGFENLRMVEKIALHLADVLETIADELLTKDFAEFLRWGFDEPGA